MTDAIFAQVKHDEITLKDRELMQELIAKAANSSHIAQMLQRILSSFDRGIDFSILETDAELTPNKAAELLNMSRPHLLTFMDKGDLPFHYVGETQKHRKIKMSDLMEFMTARAAGQEITANALHSTVGDPEDSKPFTQEELDELDSL
ncbi:helix-turn-helix domain-containing protein [Corynebacterium stationis]|uniref:helix-turn-helix domain-containing protein n=1 Tax=Corynebacterium stationis TaxID=1705 RepID=UPI00174BFC2B|nr:helix-turn-helix domain-containing protein [Corynebacterium stationis]